MAKATTDDGVGLYYEETVAGAPIVFVHEFAGDLRSFEPQVRYFSRRYRCIAYNARGYPPSDVPESFERYSQERARDDIRCVLDGLKIEKAHIVGVSMGGFAVLHFGFAYPERALSLVVAGCGYDAEPGKRRQFTDEASRTAAESPTRAWPEPPEDPPAPGPAPVCRIAEQGPWVATPNSPASSWHSSLGLGGAPCAPRRCAGHIPLAYLVDKMEAGPMSRRWSGDRRRGRPACPSSLACSRPAWTSAAAALVVLLNTGHALNLEEPGPGFKPLPPCNLRSSRSRPLALLRPTCRRRLDSRR